MGPSIASPSHDCSGTCADFAHAARRSIRPIAVRTPSLAPDASAKTLLNESEPNVLNINIIAIINPMSPTRLTTKAFLAAVAADGLCCQKPISRYDAKPDAFPADVEPEEVVGEHEEQHRSEEEIEVGEELTTLGVVRHVADRVDVDQRTYTGDEQDETHRQLIKLQSELDLKTVDRDPTEQVLGDGAVGGVAAEHGDEKTPLRRQTTRVP